MDEGGDDVDDVSDLLRQFELGAPDTYHDNVGFADPDPIDTPSATDTDLSGAPQAESSTPFEESPAPRRGRRSATQASGEGQAATSAGATTTRAKRGRGGRKQT